MERRVSQSEGGKGYHRAGDARGEGSGNPGGGLHHVAGRRRGDPDGRGTFFHCPFRGAWLCKGSVGGSAEGAV